MKITITGRHVEVTPSLRDFAEKKISKLGEFSTQLTDVHAILGVEKYRHTAEIEFKVAGRKLTAKKTTKDMYASIEEAVQALRLQAGKLKDKLRTQSSRRHRTKPGSIRDMVAEIRLEPSPAVSSGRKVVRVKGFARIPMTLEQALVEIEDSGRDVIAFPNPSTREINVLYRRPDGRLALLEP